MTGTRKSYLPATLLQRLLKSPLAAALSYPHSTDAYAQQLRPEWANSEIRAVVTSISHPNARSVRLQLRPNANWTGFAPGQFVQLGVQINGVWKQRCFSPASSAHDRRSLEFTMAVQDGGVVTPYIKHRMKVGAVVTLSAPQGEFKLPQQRPEKLLLISAGSGITPAMAMLRTLADEQHGGEIALLNYARHAADALYAEQLQALQARLPGLRLINIYTQAANAAGPSGHFQAAHLRELPAPLAEYQCYLCGPAPLMAAVEAHWAEHQLSARLMLERFQPPVSLAPAGPDEAATGELHFSNSATRVANNGSSLLEQAETAGLAPQHGCRMGICHTCTCRKQSGVVRNLQTGELSSAEAEDIRICVSAPVGDVTLAI